MLLVAEVTWDGPGSQGSPRSTQGSLNWSQNWWCTKIRPYLLEPDDFVNRLEETPTTTLSFVITPCPFCLGLQVLSIIYV